MIEVKHFVIVVEASRTMLGRALQRQLEEFPVYVDHAQRDLALLLHCKDHRFPLRVRAQFVATPSHNGFRDTETLIERTAAFHIEVQTENAKLKDHLLGAKVILNNTVIGQVVKVDNA